MSCKYYGPRIEMSLATIWFVDRAICAIIFASIAPKTEMMLGLLVWLDIVSVLLCSVSGRLRKFQLLLPSLFKSEAFAEPSELSSMKPVCGVQNDGLCNRVIYHTVHLGRNFMALGQGCCAWKVARRHCEIKGEVCFMKTVARTILRREVSLTQ